MKSVPILFVFLLMGMALAGQGSGGAPDVHQLTQAVDRRYDRLQSLQADFVESYRGMGISRDESGTLWLKRPGRMRWEYRQPREKLFITDGKDAWFYVPGERQARKSPVKKLDDLRSPLRYLLGKTKLEKEFEGLSLAPDVKAMAAGDVVLRGVPKGMRERINQVLLEITPAKQISRIVVEEADGATTEFRLLNQKENLPVSDQQFRFIPPPGVETMPLNEIGG